MNGPLAIRPSPTTDPDGAKLRGLLDLALSTERLARQRRLLTTVVAVMAIPIWLLAIWPHALPAEDRRFLLALFGGVLLLAVASCAREWRARRTFDHRVAESSGLVQDDPDPQACLTGIRRS